MPTVEFEEGDIAECPHCGLEFEMNDLSEDDWDNSDAYFEHVTTCEWTGK